VSRNLNNTWLRKRRMALKLHQKQIYEPCGVSRQAYDRWESGIATPRRKHLPILAVLLQTPIVEVAHNVSMAKHATYVHRAVKFGERVDKAAAKLQEGEADRP
jgi:transcriptional regulator with XRE-family HTH domain